MSAKLLLAVPAQLADPVVAGVARKLYKPYLLVEHREFGFHWAELLMFVEDCLVVPVKPRTPVVLVVQRV